MGDGGGWVGVGEEYGIRLSERGIGGKGWTQRDPVCPHHSECLSSFPLLVVPTCVPCVVIMSLSEGEQSVVHREPVPDCLMVRSNQKHPSSAPPLVPYHASGVLWFETRAMSAGRQGSGVRTADPSLPSQSSAAWQIPRLSSSAVSSPFPFRASGALGRERPIRGARGLDEDGQ